jgi:hypothetical protein
MAEGSSSTVGHLVDNCPHKEVIFWCRGPMGKGKAISTPPAALGKGEKVKGPIQKAKKEEVKAKGKRVIPADPAEAKQAIDDLFARHETKKTPLPLVENPPKSGKKKKQSSRDAAKEDDAFFDTRGEAATRKVVDGLKVYSLEELGIGKGGDTADCPFDCDCCF